MTPEQIDKAAIGLALSVCWILSLMAVYTIASLGGKAKAERARAQGWQEGYFKQISDDRARRNASGQFCAKKPKSWREST
jgi:hypothetical protein